jgi:molybdopterin synthase sulfur carrier subunit
VIFHIPGALREFAGGRSQVEVEHPPAPLHSALLALWTLCPGMRDRVVTEQGEVRAHINIFVGDENIRYSGGLATPVSSDSVISIVPAVSGGRVFGQAKAQASLQVGLGHVPKASARGRG